MDGSTHRYHSPHGKPTETKVHQKQSHPTSLEIHVFFSSMEWPLPASLLRLLLLIAGVEPNPGPNKIWICSVCNKRINRNSASVKCNKCGEWCHLRVCSSLKTSRQWSSQYIASCCLSNPSSQKVPSSDCSYDEELSFLKILQLNCNGLTSKFEEITSYMNKNGILLAAIHQQLYSSQQK